MLRRENLPNGPHIFCTVKIFFVFLDSKPKVAAKSNRGAYNFYRVKINYVSTFNRFTVLCQFLAQLVAGVSIGEQDLPAEEAAQGRGVDALELHPGGGKEGDVGQPGTAVFLSLLRGSVCIFNLYLF